MVTALKLPSTIFLLVVLASQLPSENPICEKQTVVVNVHDKHGQFIPSLQTNDFLARMHGKELEVISAVERAEPPRIVIALDASGDMVGLEWSLQKVADEIVRISSEKTQLGVVLFSDRILQVVEFGKPRSEITSVLSNIPRAAGRNSYRDSLSYANKVFGIPQIGDCVILVSNGSFDDESKTSNDALIQAYLSAGIRFSVIRPFKYTEPSPREKHAAAELDELASSTGGFVERILSPKEFNSLDETIIQKLARHYVLQLRTTSIEKTAPWQVEVIDSSHKTRKDAEIGMPRRLLQCKIP
jgi:hypothetical protein